MTKEQILEYAGKGDVEHNGFIINVIKKDFDNVLKDFIEIELKPINEYTDGPIHTAFLGYISDQDLIELENSLKKEFAIMKKQEEIMKKEPLKLNQVKNISSNYEATFEDEDKQKYVLMLSNTKDTCQLVLYDKEPLHSINKPIEIDGTVLKSRYSFWLDSGTYKKSDFENILKKQEIKKINENKEIISTTTELLNELKQTNILEYENLQKIAYRLEMLDSNYTFHLRETILDKAEIIKYNNLDKTYSSDEIIKNELIEEIEDIAADYGVVLDDSEECESL